ncbi:MAG: ferritin family protein [Candidatus Omnitrophota bacterium]
MTNVFSPQEILRIAIKVEENGKQLYEMLAKNAKEKKIKDIWNYLATQEGLHKKTFEEMLEKAGDYVVYEYSPGEYDAYLKAISAQYVFAPEHIAKKIYDGFASDIDALDFGISIEKDSILIYSALRKYIKADKQSAIDKVLFEEKDHLVKLILLKDSLKK